jgi:hypothetical protein
MNCNEQQDKVRCSLLNQLQTLLSTESFESSSQLDSSSSAILKPMLMKLYFSLSLSDLAVAKKGGLGHKHEEKKLGGKIECPLNSNSDVEGQVEALTEWLESVKPLHQALQAKYKSTSSLPSSSSSNSNSNMTNDPYIQVPFKTIEAANNECIDTTSDILFDSDRNPKVGCLFGGVKNFIDVSIEDGADWDELQIELKDHGDASPTKVQIYCRDVGPSFSFKIPHIDLPVKDETFTLLTKEQYLSHDPDKKTNLFELGMCENVKGSRFIVSNLKFVKKSNIKNNVEYEYDCE